MGFRVCAAYDITDGVTCIQHSIEVLLLGIDVG
jgi:hypothetical protein